MQTTTMSILAMLRLASTTASTPVADIIGCSVLPARAVIARDSTADRARNSCCSERRP